MIYYLIRLMKTKEAVAIGTCSPEGEVPLDVGFIVRTISKAEYDSYIALDLFPPYKAKDPKYVWVARAGPDGLYFGIKTWEEDKMYAQRHPEE